MSESTWEAIGSRLGLVSAVVGVACFATVALANVLTRSDAWGVRVLAVLVALVAGLVGAFICLRPFLATNGETEHVALAKPAEPAAVWTAEVADPRPSLARRLNAGTELANAGLTGAELEAGLAEWVDETAALLESPHLAGYFRAANTGERSAEERLTKALARLRTILDEMAGRHR